MEGVEEAGLKAKGFMVIDTRVIQHPPALMSYLFSFLSPSIPVRHREPLCPFER